MQANSLFSVYSYPVTLSHRLGLARPHSGSTRLRCDIVNRIRATCLIRDHLPCTELLQLVAQNRHIPARDLYAQGSYFERTSVEKHNDVALAVTMHENHLMGQPTSSIEECGHTGWDLKIDSDEHQEFKTSILTQVTSCIGCTE